MAKTAKAKRKPNGDESSSNGPASHSFASLQTPRSLSPGVLEYVKDQKFLRMTPVQAATIPQFLSHKDVAVQAVTGSGKTLAFLIPVVEILGGKKYKRQQIGALILSPTRELAQQTYAVAKKLAEYVKQPEPLLLVGGGNSGSSNGTNSRPVTEDLKAFMDKGCDLLIGTPGRVDDILSRYATIDCSELECLVLDEADVLLNMGFSTTLQSILGKLPKMRRTALFSATQSSSTTSNLTEWMQRVGMRNPIWIDVAVSSSAPTEKKNNATGKTLPASTAKQQATPSSLTNYYLVTKLDEKLTRLAAFLQDHADEKVIVFFLTCACVDFYGNAFQKIFPEMNASSMPIELLHGKMVQKRREKTMTRFRDVPGIALFCTDVAARGLDVSDVQWVVQVDAPQDPSYFVHRVGRAARAGRTGQSLLFLTPKEEAYVDLLRMRNVPLQALASTERCCPPDEVDKGNDKKHSAKSNDRLVYSAKDGSALDDVLPAIRKVVLKDRDLLEKGTKAFTSYIRAYKEHHCAFIFRFASLNLGLLATSFCLLRLPKMPELRDILLKHKGNLPHFKAASRDVDIFKIPFVDKAREIARQKRLLDEAKNGGKNFKLLQAEKRKVDKEERQKERRQKSIDKGRNPDKKRGRQAQMVDEWDDLAKEERLVRKLRRGKITKDEFNKQMGEV